MEILVSYGMALIALAVGTAAIYMALIEFFPIKWLYYHYFIRKPINWAILIGLLLLTYNIYQRTGEFPLWALVPLLLTVLAVILTYKMHQEVAFKAVDYPELTSDIENLPILDDMEIAVVEYEGVTKCYPLDYVIHHHIVNDKFNSKIVSLTYCAMCRSIIPFDVTEIGPLFVGSFKNANMVVADRKTKTFFQQASFKSIIGKLHPSELTMIPFQILSWSEVKVAIPEPEVVKVTNSDFKEFQLPIPGIWKRIIASDSTPGLTAENRDKSFPPRTHIIGIIDESINDQVVYIKEEILKEKLVVNTKNNFFLVGIGNNVLAFKNSLNNSSLDISIDKTEIVDSKSQSRWDIRGKYISGSLDSDLVPIAFSHEYWFSWKKFHEDSQLIRL